MASIAEAAHRQTLIPFIGCSASLQDARQAMHQTKPDWLVVCQGNVVIGAVGRDDLKSADPAMGLIGLVGARGGCIRWLD